MPANILRPYSIVLYTVLCAGGTALLPAAFAQEVEDIGAKQGHSAYHQDGRGIILRNQYGLCWRAGYWTPEDAVAGCDGPLVPPVTKAIAPPVETKPEPTVTATPEPAPPVAVAPTRCDFKFTLSGDGAFAFNRATLSTTGQQQVNDEVLSKLRNCTRIDSITVTGHTDQLGSRQYNQKLSERRAEAVSAYLRNKGIAASFEVTGAGATQPLQQCDRKLPRRERIACLAPNRRVVIEVRGMGN